MPNVTAMEPRVLVDLIAMTLDEVANAPPGKSPGEVFVISPWISDVELTVMPGGCHGLMGKGLVEPDTQGLVDCLIRLRQYNARVAVGVLAYGESLHGLKKDLQQFARERAVLQRLLAKGVEIYLCPGLHAKGIVTELGLITGSTNYTRNGLHLQMQNANYFAYDHPDYAGNLQTLAGYLNPAFRAMRIP